MAEFVFPKVELTDPKFSNRSFTVPRRTSLAPGPVVPILKLDLIPGDKLDLKVNALLESFPMLAPMLGTMHLRFDFFFEPWSNLYGFMDNNERSTIDAIINRNLHRTKIGFNKVGTRSIQTSGLAPGFGVFRGFSLDDITPTFSSSLLNYLGVPAGYVGATSFETVPNEDDGTPETASVIKQDDFSLNGVFAYLDIIRNYYVNNQEDFIPYVSSLDDSPGLTSDDVVPSPSFRYGYASLELLDDLFKQLRYSEDGIFVSNTYQGSIGTTLTNVPYLADLLSPLSPMKGLFLRTYKMDLLRGIMKNDPDAYKTFVGVDENGRTTVEDIRFANKMHMFKERIELTNGRFKDWMKTIWNVSPNSKLDIPYYLGSVGQYIYNNDVVATAVGSNITQTLPRNAQGNILGQQAGFWAGRISRENDAINLNCNEYGTLMVMVSLVPIVDYSQGFELNDLKTKFLDIFYPQFAQLGFQDVSRYEMSALPTISHISPDGVAFGVHSKDEVVGKRVAWSEYMSGLGRNYGDFAYGESLDYWVNNRQYTQYFTPHINNSFDYENVSPELREFADRYGDFSISTYVRPDILNQNFAFSSPYAQNFRLQALFDVNLVRPIPKQTMPHM